MSKCNNFLKFHKISSYFENFFAKISRNLRLFSNFKLDFKTSNSAFKDIIFKKVFKKFLRVI
jgi:hypothetical protein